jgi:hypothetical protein
MGSSAFILSDYHEHTPQRLLGELAIVSFEADVMCNFHNHKNFKQNGQFSSVDVNILDKSCLSGLGDQSDYGKHFSVYVNAIHKEELELGAALEFDWLVPEGRLVKAAYIEDVRDENSSLIFSFLLKYLERNRRDSVWFGDKWAFNFNSLVSLSNSAVSPTWFQKKPE